MISGRPATLKERTEKVPLRAADAGPARVWRRNGESFILAFFGKCLSRCKFKARASGLFFFSGNCDRCDLHVVFIYID
jgi:hypothetical protein